MRSASDLILDRKIGTYNGDFGVLEGITAVSGNARVAGTINNVIIASDLPYSTRRTLID
jgi:hypothetical protein